MSTHMTKTWFDGEKIVTQEIPEEKIYWQGLTDDEIKDLWSWSMTREAERTATTQQHAFARAIETKLKQKNT